MDTILLDRSAWDLVLDSNGNIARAEPPYALAQDVASAIRLFAGELYYNTRAGVPYFAQILGHQPPLQLMKAQFVAAANTVPGVVGAVCYISSVQGRRVTGQVQFSNEDGTTAVVALAHPPGTELFILGQSSLGGLNVI